MKAKINIDNICIVTQLFHPNNQAIAVRMKYLADAFKNHGIDVSVMHSGELGNTSSAFHSIHLISPLSSNKDRTAIRLIKELITSSEVFFRVLFSSNRFYLITSPPFTIAIAAALACRIKFAKYVFDVRDEYPEVYFTQGLIKPDCIIGRILQSIEKCGYRHSVLTLTVTERIVEKIRKRVNDESKIYLLRNGYTEHIKRINDLKYDPFNVVFHGNMGQFLNPELIVEVARKCAENESSIYFNIYGWGAKMDVIIEAEKHLSNLKYKGVFNHSDVQSILETTSLGIAFQGDTPLSKNAFPVKVAEYLGAGIPVMVTPFGEVGDFVHKHKVGYRFENNQAQEIFETLKDLQANPHKLREFNNETKNVEKILSRKLVSRLFVEHYFEKQ